MHVRRFFLPPGHCGRDEVLLSGREAHHAAAVLRLRPGDALVILDGAGGVLDCRVAEASKRQLRLRVVQRQLRPPLPYRVTLFQAVPKGRTMDVIVQKATELGAAKIVPLLTGRTVPDFEGDSAEAKLEKWRQDAIEAVKQCGNPWLPSLEPPASLPAVLARGESFDLALVASLTDAPSHPRRRFTEFAAQHGRPPRSVAVWIGPEGDFTPEELAAIQRAGALPVTLGPLVLRSDTAAICALSIVSYELQASGPAINPDWQPVV